MRLSKAGYSLLEVLVAFTVMAVTLAVLVPGQGRLAARVTNAEIQTLAQDFAYSRLAGVGIVEPIRGGVRSFSYLDWQVEEEIAKRAISSGSNRQIWVTTVIIRNRQGEVIASAQGLSPVSDDG